MLFFRNREKQDMCNSFVSVLSIFRSRQGQGLVEYVLIISLVAIVLIAGLLGLQGGLSGLYLGVVAAL
jgi:Flp pilus assembly pilin Flp